MSFRNPSPHFTLAHQPRIHELMPIFLQNLAITIRGLQIARVRYTSHFRRTLEELERSVHGPLEALHELQRQRLVGLVDHARANVPFYRDLPPPSDARDPLEAIERTLKNIPPLDKNTYALQPEAFRARNISRRRLIRDVTSGTTGTALTLWQTPERVAEKYATVWRQCRSFGVQPRDPHFSFGGNVVAPRSQTRPPFWRRNAYGRQTLFSVFHMSPANLPSYIDAMHRIPARYAQGYPSALHLIARAMLDAGRPLPRGRFAAVFTSSESLLAFQRDAIEEAFGAPARDYYSSSENLVAMSECAARRLHLDMEFGIAEVEPEEETDAYVRGPLLLTGLGNEAAPLFRYRIGDIGRRAKDPCPCGRPGVTFLAVDGRDDDYVVTPDGSLVGRLDHLFKDQVDVAEAQILQETKDAIEIQLVPRPGYGDDSRERLLAQIRSRLGDDIGVTIRRVEAIAREPNGKFRAVKSRPGRKLR
ncbi:MAG: phenylacetate--CoA ligase family protein [Deltaproteobacteria bacterium]|nr:MAG: phenylacetate--CoA ligase family protein [Deltaproteobacteria bacterium]